MEETSLPPGRTVPPTGAPDSLDGAGANTPVSSFAAASQRYPLETLEVHSEGSGNPQYTYTPQANSVPFSRRKATVVSLLITLLVMLLTAASATFIINRQIPGEGNSSQLGVPEQDVSVGEAGESLPELEGVDDALLVNGDVIARGDLKVVTGEGFSSVLSATTLTEDRNITLPNASGVVCLDENNCGFATEDQLTAQAALLDQLQAQLGQIVIPPASPEGVTSLNGLAGVVSIQGTANQVSVSTGGGSVTLSTPQDIAATSSPTFNGLTLNGGLALNGNLSTTGTVTLSLDCTGFTNSGKLTTNASGEIICGNDVGGGGGTAPSNAEYLVLTLDGTLTDERVLTAGTNIGFTDGGANGNLTVNVVNNPTFSGLLTADGGLSLGAGQALTINGEAFTDLTGTGLQFSAGTLQATLGTDIDTTEIVNGTILAEDFNSTNVAGPGTDNFVLTYDDATGGFTWVDPAGVGAGTNFDITDGTTTENVSTGDTVTFADGTDIDVTVAATDTVTVNNTSTLQTVTDRGSTTTNLVTTSGGLTVSGGSFTLGGEAFTSLTGTGLQFNAGSLETTLGTTIDLTSEVTGTLPITNGGTGATTQQAAINNLSGLTTQGDLLFHDGTNSTRLPRGTDGQCLLSNTTTILWGSCPGDGVGISSINGETGPAITINNASAAANAITIDDATTAAKGIASFDDAYFTVSSGDVSIDDIYLSNTGDTGVGAYTFTGTMDLTGTVLQGANALVFEGTTADTFETILAVADPTADNSITLPDASGTVCLTSGNCAGVGGTGDILNNGQPGPVRVGTNDATSTILETNNVDRLTIDSTGAATFSETLAVQGSSVTVGEASTTNGSLVLQNGTNANTVTLQSGITSASYALTLPTAVGSTNQCLKAQNGTGTLFWDDCEGGAGSSQNAFTTIDVDAGTDPVAASSTDTLTINDGTNIDITGTGGNAIQIAVVNNPTFSGLVTASSGINVNGETFTDLTGTGLQNNAGSLETTLGTSVDLTTEVTGTLPVSNGGTGATTFTSNGVLYGNGTGAIQATAAGTTGQCLVATTGSAPTWGSCAGSGSGVTLQAAYDNGNTITTTDARDIDVTLADTTTDANFLVDIATGSTGRFAVQGNGTDVLGVTATGVTIDQLLTVNATTDIGANTLQGTTAVIDFTNFDVDATGNVTAAGDVAVDGGQLSVFDGVANSFTIQAEGAIGGDYTVSIPTEIAGADFFCLENAGNCTGSSSFDITDGTTTETVGNGDTITFADGTDTNAVVSAPDTVTVNNTSTLETVTGRGATTANLVNLNGGIAVDGTNFTVSGTTGDVLTAGDITVQGNSTIGDANTDTLTINAGSSGTGITFGDASFSDCTLTTVTGVLTCGAAAVTTIGTIDSETKSANGAVITGNNLVLQTADASNPGLVSTGTQTFAGTKSFNGQVNFNNEVTLDEFFSIVLDQNAGSDRYITTNSSSIEIVNESAAGGAVTNIATVGAFVVSDSGFNDRFVVNTSNGNTDISGALTVDGNTTLGNAGGDSLTVTGSSIQFANGFTSCTAINTDGSGNLGCDTSTFATESYVTLQNAYDGGNTITTADASDIDITLADTTADSNFLVDIATGSTGRFAVQGNGTDVLGVTSTGVTVDQPLTVNADTTVSVASDSTAAFEVQDAGDQAYLTVDTTNLAVEIGNGTDDVVLALDAFTTDPGTAPDGAMFYDSDDDLFRCRVAGAWVNCAGGSGGGTVTLKFIPEFGGGTLHADGSDNSGTMTADYDSTDDHTYYEWTTAQGTQQDYDIVVRTQLPSDFQSIGAAGTFQFWHYDGDGTGTDDEIDWSLTDASGTSCFSDTDINASAAATWEQEAASTLGSCTFAADDIITFVFKLKSDSTGSGIRLGEFEFQYDN